MGLLHAPSKMCTWLLKVICCRSPSRFFGFGSWQGLCRLSWQGSCHRWGVDVGASLPVGAAEVDGIIISNDQGEWVGSWIAVSWGVPWPSRLRTTDGFTHFLEWERIWRWPLSSLTANVRMALWFCISDCWAPCLWALHVVGWKGEKKALLGTLAFVKNRHLQCL